MLDCSMKSLEHIKTIEKTAKGAERERLEKILATWESLIQMAEAEIQDITTSGEAHDEPTRRSAEKTRTQIKETQECIRTYMKTLHEKKMTTPR